VLNDIEYDECLKETSGGLVARASPPVKCASHCTQNRSQLRQKSCISFAPAKFSRRFCRNIAQEQARIDWAVHAAFISLNTD
jgi:hypothetical protein